LKKTVPLKKYAQDGERCKIAERRAILRAPLRYIQSFFLLSHQRLVWGRRTAITYEAILKSHNPPEKPKKTQDPIANTINEFKWTKQKETGDVLL